MKQTKWIKVIVVFITVTLMYFSFHRGKRMGFREGRKATLDTINTIVVAQLGNYKYRTKLVFNDTTVFHLSPKAEKSIKD